MASIEEIVEFVDMIREDFATPSNVKEAMNQIKNILNDDSYDAAIKVDKCIDLIDALQEDPNIESFTRTNLWTLVSYLEVLDGK